MKEQKFIVSIGSENNGRQIRGKISHAMTQALGLEGGDALEITITSPGKKGAFISNSKKLTGQAATRAKEAQASARKPPTPPTKEKAKASGNGKAQSGKTVAKHPITNTVSGSRKIASKKSSGRKTEVKIEIPEKGTTVKKTVAKRR